MLAYAGPIRAAGWIFRSCLVAAAAKWSTSTNICGAPQDDKRTCDLRSAVRTTTQSIIREKCIMNILRKFTIFNAMTVTMVIMVEFAWATKVIRYQTKKEKLACKRAERIAKVAVVDIIIPAFVCCKHWVRRCKTEEDAGEAILFKFQCSRGMHRCHWI